MSSSIPLVLGDVPSREGAGPASPGPAVPVRPAAAPLLPALARESPDGRRLVLRVRRWRIVCFAVLEVLVLLLAAILVAGDVAAGAAVSCCLALVTTAVLWWLVRQRTELGPEGIVMRSALRTRRAPWPATREGLWAVALPRPRTTSVNGAGASPVGKAEAWMTAEVSVSGIRNRVAVPIPCTRVSGVGPELRVRGGGTAVDVVDENLDAVWAWATARGYVRPGA